MEPQWSPVFENLLKDIQSATRSDSREFVYSVLREIETQKSAIHAALEVPTPNAAHRAQLKLGESTGRLFPA